MAICPAWARPTSKRHTLIGWQRKAPRFTDWYSNSPVCSPSRAALLTGRYPCHAGVRSILAGHRTATGLPPSVPVTRNRTEGTRVLHCNVRKMAFGTRGRLTSRTPRV